MVAPNVGAKDLPQARYCSCTSSLPRISRGQEQAVGGEVSTPTPLMRGMAEYRSPRVPGTGVRE